MISNLWEVSKVTDWSLDYYRSVLFLVNTDPPLCGGGFALARPMVEALLRIHVVAGGSDCDLACIRADRYRTDFEDVAEELDELFQLEFFAKTFNAQARLALHSYTHSGAMQIARRFSGKHRHSLVHGRGEKGRGENDDTGLCYGDNHRDRLLRLRPRAREGQ